LTDACGETDTFGAQTRQAFIECLNSCAALHGLRHGPPLLRGRGVSTAGRRCLRLAAQALL
jgi:hypothetical protein